MMKAQTDIMVIIKQIPQPIVLASTQIILREKYLLNNVQVVQK